MTERPWNLPIRFFLAAGVAALLSGTALLAPRWVRNHQLEQQVLRQQQELVELVSINQQRQDLLDRLEQSPELLSTLATQPSRSTAEYVTMPDVLAISPEILPIQSEQGTPFQVADSEQAVSAPPAGFPVPVGQMLEQVAQSARLRQSMHGVACGVLLLGCLPWTAAPYHRLKPFCQRTWKICTARYRLHPPQKTLAGPHGPLNSPLEVSKADQKET